MTPLPLAAPSLRREHVDPRRWTDWRWQLQNMLRSAEDFAPFAVLSRQEKAGLAASPGLFRVGATPYYADLIDPVNPACPIRMQSIPSVRELDFTIDELGDPLGEDSHRPVPSVVHKYPDRALFLVVDRCAIYCRHCNRRRLVGGDDPPTASDIDQGIDYIARTRRIRDVLLSGGDPLLLSNGKLADILARLRAIDHVEIIRIGTRLPVVCPMRIDAELCRVLQSHHPLYINTHFNHPKEITDEARRACTMLVDHGIPMGNQTVLLRGVNSSVRCLRALMRELLKMRVKPYYLFQGDTVLGTDHLRTPVDAAIALMDGLRGWMSGMAIPHLVIDAPGGGGKIPIGPDYVVARDDNHVTVRTYRGQLVRYPEPRQRDCSVPYDAVYFADQADDDDREGSAEIEL
ncbi:MAG: KamA family radical SAM protein [Proteobacteria bacterium]|nr:KamA family radical SAM protein [Pseudomonadota bacterium]